MPRVPSGLSSTVVPSASPQTYPSKHPGNPSLLRQPIYHNMPPPALLATIILAIKPARRPAVIWPWEQLREFRAQQEHVTPRRYISGESHYYLGKQYQLKVIASLEHKHGVKLLRCSLAVSVREQKPDKIQTLLNDWYRHKARDVFARRLDQVLWVTGRPFVFLPCKPSGAAALPRAG